MDSGYEKLGNRKLVLNVGDKFDRALKNIQRAVMGRRIVHLGPEPRTALLHKRIRFGFKARTFPQRLLPSGTAPHGSRHSLTEEFQQYLTGSRGSLYREETILPKITFFRFPQIQKNMKETKMVHNLPLGNYQR